MLAERIRKARDDAGLSRDKLAVRVGVTGQSIYRYERGDMRPRGDVVRRLADVLGHPVEWFYEDEPTGGEAA